MNDKQLKDLTDIFNDLNELKSNMGKESVIEFIRQLNNITADLGDLIFEETHPGPCTEVFTINENIPTKDWTRNLFSKVLRQHLDKYHHFEK